MHHNREVLTLEQVQACVETIARFHAQCYVYEEKRTGELGRPYRVWEDYNECLREPPKGQSWRNAGRDVVIDFLKVYSKYRNYPNFVNEVDLAVTKLYEDASALMRPHPLCRNVVVHRDLWTNNILFKKHAGGKYQALIVDFQTVIYSCPMMDLSSFMYFNTSRIFRETYLKNIINLYYDVLKTELENSNVEINKIIDCDSLHKCYDESTVFGISQAAIILPITVMDTSMREKIFEDPEQSLRINEVSRSSEIIGVAKVDGKYLERVNELLDEIVERYIIKNVL